MQPSSFLGYLFHNEIIEYFVKICTINFTYMLKDLLLTCTRSFIFGVSRLTRNYFNTNFGEILNEENILRYKLSGLSLKLVVFSIQ